MIMTNNTGLTYRDIVECYYLFFLLPGNKYITPAELLPFKKEKAVLKMIEPITETKFVNWEMYYHPPSAAAPLKSAMYCLSEAYWVVL